MNNKELMERVHSSMFDQCRKRGYATPVDVLMEIGVLPKEKYEEWRFGKVPYLEQICNTNLHKLSFILTQISSYARENAYKPSFTYYKQWGMKKKNGMKHTRQLRFSKSGNPDIERAYATHYVDERRIEKLKEEHRAL